MNIVKEIRELIEGLRSDEVLEVLANRFADSGVFSTSFGMEDQVISDQIFSNNLPIQVFTLDTGRLFPETYSVWNRTVERYKKRIETYYPNSESVERLLSEKGPNSFYESVENRQECCGIRKVEPLKRALEGNKLWITGIRQDQSTNRNTMDWVEWDEKHQLIKVHPLFYWTIEEVKEYIKQHNIPYNSLHDKGFPSIGCAPCTRAVPPGGDSRDGRWWWEDQSKKECGLHITSHTK
jgi:phosphoadenosine phosphosulfate reductase